MTASMCQILFLDLLLSYELLMCCFLHSLMLTWTKPAVKQGVSCIYIYIYIYNCHQSYHIFISLFKLFSLSATAFLFLLNIYFSSFIFVMVRLNRYTWKAVNETSLRQNWGLKLHWSGLHLKEILSIARSGFSTLPRLFFVEGTSRKWWAEAHHTLHLIG